MSGSDSRKTPIGSLPLSWRTTTIGDILRSKKLDALYPPDYPDEIFEYYSIPAYQEGRRPAFQNGRSIRSAKNVMIPGTVLFGKLNPRVEKVWLVGNHSEHRKIGSGEWLQVLPKEDIDSMFVYFLMWSAHVMPKAKQLITGSTPSRQRVNPKAFYQLVIPVPPSNEQKAIANILSLIESAIENQEKIIQTTTELKKALMQKLFTEGLRGEKQKQTEIGPIPASWKCVELGTICKKPEYGFTASANAKGNIKILRITDIQENGVVWETVPFCTCPAEKLDRYLLKNNDIVFARIGATTGKSYLVKVPPKAIFASYLIRVRTHDIINPIFLYYFFQSSEYWRQINASKHNNLKGGVNGSILSGLLVPFPAEKQEQDAIATALSTLDDKITFHARRKSVLTEMFKAMLHQLMTGQIRVEDLSLKPQAEAVTA